MRVKEPTITKTVHARATIMHDVVEVFKFNQPIQTKEEGWENQIPVLRATRGEGMNQKEDLQNSLKKSKREIRLLALYNKDRLRLWVTLTMKEDRYDDKKTLRKLLTWLKSERRRVGNFDSLIVFERHKRCEECAENKVELPKEATSCEHPERPKALHIHALLGNYNGKLKPATNKKTGKLLIGKHGQVYNLETYEKYGFSKVEYISSPERIAAYITKYVTKEVTSLGLNKKRYWASRGLKKPPVVDNPEWLDEVEGKHTRNYANMHGIGFIYPSELIPATPIKHQ